MFSGIFIKFSGVKNTGSSKKTGDNVKNIYIKF